VESEGLEGAAGGVPQRLGWWQDLYERWTLSASTFLFGLGYGFPLIDFKDYYGITVREPHNSYISILARLGLSGGLAFLWMHILLLHSWYHTYRACQRMHWQEGENRLLTLLIFFILIWVNAIGEDPLEKPFVTIPYYFFWGIVLRMNWYLKYNLPSYHFSPPAAKN
jgi:O-antigen ligase